MNNNINNELSNYLKTKIGLTRLMTELKSKYITLSRPSGSITLENLTKEETIDIGNILGKRLYEGTTIKTSFKELTKKINEGKYRNFDWILTLNYYFGETIITKKEKQNNTKNEEYIFFKNIYEQNKQNIYIEQIKEIITNESSINKLIKKKYSKNKQELQKDLNNIFLLLDNIPTTPTPLAVYSSLTGNPHYLDLNKNKANLFLKILSYIKGINYSNTNEAKINILSEINVYTDPISNYVITYKLIGTKILDQLSQKNEVLNLNLLNLNKIERISTINNKVYVFENPSMLTSLMGLNVPIVITSGIPNVSLYCLLSKLENSGNEILYNGDFDPEGLLIAEKLKIRFPKLKLICYDQIDYINSKSKEKLSKSRIKKLDKITTKELEIIKNMIINNKVSGYQEQNINRIINYIENNH